MKTAFFFVSAYIGMSNSRNLGRKVDKKLTIPQNCLHSLTDFKDCILMIASHLPFIGVNAGLPFLIMKYMAHVYQFSSEQLTFVR